MDGPHKRTLEEALKLVGNEKRLATTLGILQSDLRGYLNGTPMPHQVFLDALDIVAYGQKR